MSCQWSDWDLGTLEARSTPWLSCRLPSESALMGYIGSALMLGRVFKWHPHKSQDPRFPRGTLHHKEMTTVVPFVYQSFKCRGWSVHVIPGDPVHVWQFESTEGYWCELNVDGVIEGQPALQIHQLFVVPTLRCLHHIVDVEHPRLSAVRHNHHTQVWQPGRADTRMFRLHPWNHSRRTRNWIWH